MAWIMRTSSMALVIGILSLAGCTGPEVSSESIAESYKDADYRVASSVGGVHEETKTVQVPAGATKLTVKAAYSCGGVCSFELRNPASMTQEEDDVQGGKATADEAWFVANDPMPGSWKFAIDIQGGANYAFGFYVEP